MTLAHAMPPLVPLSAAEGPTPTAGTAPAWQPGEWLQLRPHNILCLQGWQGMGYSPEFTLNMDRIWHHLQDHPETLVVLAPGPDQLCRACPLNGPAGCQHDVAEGQWITAHDSATLARTGLAFYQPYPWQHIEHTIARSFTGAMLAGFCARCAWQPLGVCAAGIDRLRDRLQITPAPDR